MGPNDDNETVLYEVNLEADAAVAGPFDTWLRDHIADMLQLAGFLSAEILEDAASPPGRIRRTVQYRLASQAALDRYLEEDAPRMREQAVAKFGDQFAAERRVLAHREEFIRGAVSTENCLNCGEVLTGQHCSHCGQRARVRVLSFTSLLREFLGDVTDFDARIWRTLRPLTFKPGLLTVEFLRGRRTHYSPPFRMYLILSVAFFLVASLGNPNIGIQFDTDGGTNLQIKETPGMPAATDRTVTAPSPPASAAGPAVRPRGTDAAAARLEKQREQIIERIVEKLPQKDQAKARADLARDLGAMTQEQIAPIGRFVDDPCGKENMHVEGPDFVKQYEPRLREACRKIVSDSQSFGHAVFQNIPKMMFIFLPLIAGLMFLLYLGSGRYYIEHLLFFVHYHAFFFLAGLAVVTLSRLSQLFAGMTAEGWFDGASNALIAVFMLYVPLYLYLAMRRVYAQGRIVTGLKFFLLVVGYLIFMTFTAVGLLAYTALTL